MGQTADDQPQGTQGLVDLDALLELLSHRTRCLLILTACMFSTSVFGTGTRSKCMGWHRCALCMPVQTLLREVDACNYFEPLPCFEIHLAAYHHTLQSNAAE